MYFFIKTTDTHTPRVDHTRMHALEHTKTHYACTARDCCSQRPREVHAWSEGCVGLLICICSAGIRIGVVWPNSYRFAEASVAATDGVAGEGLPHPSMRSHT
eukprot:COSAG02_NODE_4828_length_4932_cov_37.882888_2_plen_102_part_00